MVARFLATDVVTLRCTRLSVIISSISNVNNGTNNLVPAI